MEKDNPGRSQLHDVQLSDIDVGGTRNVSKLEKLETERTQTTTSRSITTNDHQGATQYTNGDDSMRRSLSPEIMIDDALQQQSTSTAANESDDRRSRKTEQRSEVVEQRSGTQEQRYDAEKRRSTARKQSSDTKEQARSARSLSRRDRNVAAAEMAYRTVGLPADIEYSHVSKRSKTVSTGGQSKPRGGLSGLEDTADFIVEDAMEQAIEAMYGKKRRRKMISDTRTSSAGVTRSLDRDTRTTTTEDRQATFGYDTTLTGNRALGQTINETTSRDESRKKAVCYTALQDDEDIEEDLNLRRPASADGRLTNRVDYMARRRARAVHRLPNAALSRSRYQAATYTSPHMSQHQRRTATSLLPSQRVGGYFSETELMQSSSRPDRRQHFNGDDSDFSTTIEVKSPLSTQFQTENGRYGSDDSETQNLEYSSSHCRIPTLTKGMVTKVLHGDRPRLQTAEMFVSEICRPDVQIKSSPVQFTASPPHSIVLSSPALYRDRQLSAVVPVGSVAESRSTFRPSAVDDNFLLRQAPAYQLARQTAVYGGGETGRSTPTSIHDEWPSSSYAAFSNEPIIVANLDDDFLTKTTSMRRAQSLLALDEMNLSPVSAGIPRSQTPNYASRPDISMTNRQVLNLYLFNKRSPGDGGKGRTAEYETLTRTMTFGEERAMTGNKQTQTMTLPRRDRTQYVTRQQPKTKHSSKYIQTDLEHISPKPSQRRKPIPSRVTEETVIMKPSITETRETEMVGDVFAARRQISSKKPETPAVRSSGSLVTDAHKESLQEESEEEMLETTVVEEKEQRIEMTIREDLEFSLQRSRGNGQTVTGSAAEGRVEPWWIPDTFEAFVERKRQKITQTKDMENKDDHSKRIDIEYGAGNSSETFDASESNNFVNSPNYETNVDSQSTVRNDREDARNVRIPIFLEGCYNSPMHGMTSPSSSLVRTKMRTHSEPEMNRRHQYYLAKRDKHYDSLFDDSRRKPLITDQSNNENSFLVTSSHANKRHQTSSADVTELRLEVIDDEEASDNSSSASQEPHSAERRYVSSYSQYISPPPSSGVNMASTTGNDDITTSHSHTGNRASHQPMMSGTHEVFRTSKTINVKPKNGDGEAYGHDDDQIPSLDHFDRVLTEIEDELPPPPPPPPLSTVGQKTSSQAPQASTSQRHYITSSTTPSAEKPLTHKKSKPKPPEKSWKHSDPLPPKSGKLYSSHKHPADAITSGHEKQRSTASWSETQSTSLKATDKGIIPTSSAAANRQQATGADFRHELGDRSYISISLTEPVQKEDQGCKAAVVTQEQAAPGGFTYGWKTQEQKKRKHAPQPGSYQLRHSRWPAEEYETAATAF